MNKNKGKKNQILMNGIILAVIAAGLCVYFFAKGGWGAAQVIVVIIVSLISAFQFWIYYNFFKE